MDYPYLIPPVFYGIIKLCYTNIQTRLVLMTTFFCVQGCRLNTTSPHSHPFHQICISEEWIQICFSAISAFLHILFDQHCHHCISEWNSLCHQPSSYIGCVGTDVWCDRSTQQLCCLSKYNGRICNHPFHCK